MVCVSLYNSEGAGIADLEYIISITSLSSGLHHNELRYKIIEVALRCNNKQKRAKVG